MSLANAKKRFLELSGQRKDGKSPKQLIEQQAQRETNTVGKLVTEWYTNYALKNRKKPQQIKQQIDADIIPTLGHFQLDAIETIDITKALDKIVKRGAHIHANRVLSTIKQAFKYGKSRGSIKHNPAADIRAKDIGGKEKPRERVLNMDEIKKLWLFLDSDGCYMTPQLRYAIKIMLLTGVRTSELRLAKWHEFNLDESLWVIPAQNSKTDKVHKVHLSTQVKSLLTKLKGFERSEYVIVSAIPTQALSENALARAIKRIQARLSIAQWTAHDLRRTFATQLGETLRVDPVVIEKCLGHKMPKIMETYNKNEMLPERKDALDKWGQYVESLVKNSNVVAIKQVA